MIKLFWKCAAKLLAKPAVADYLIERSKRTPYFNLTSPDGSETYMERWWLFNPYDYDTRKTKYPWCPISIRIHHICTPDKDRVMHDHPWNARTVILKGWYRETRPTERDLELMDVCAWYPEGESHLRSAGDTASLKFNGYHRVTSVSKGGVYTMFITGKYRGVWGFLVGGTKVPWRKYLGTE